MGEITRDELSKQLREDIVYNSDKVAKVADVEIHGRTLVNLLGRAGNAIYKQFSSIHAHGTVGYNNDEYILSNTQAGAWITTLNSEYTFTKGKYYIILGDVYLQSGDKASVSLQSQSSEYLSYEYSSNKINEWVTCWQSSIVGDPVAGHPKPYAAFSIDGTNPSAKFKNLRIYEIDKVTQDKIARMSRKEIDEMFPYVDDAKCVVNPYIECKENLLNNNDWGYFSSNADGVAGDGMGGDTYPHIGFSYFIPCEPNTTYTLLNPFQDEKALISFRTADGRTHNVDGDGWGGIGKDRTVTSGSASKYITVHYTNNHNGKSLRLIRNGGVKPTLVKGPNPKLYDECHNSRILFETKLYGGESISRRNDGIYVKNSEYDEISIDGSKFRFSFARAGNGYKHVWLRGVINADINLSDTNCIRYDGKNIKFGYPQLTEESIGISGPGITRTNLDFCLPNRLTGWGDNYKPTDEEIRAFFLGWSLMTEAGGLYNDNTGVAQKIWRKLWCGVGNYFEYHNVKVVGVPGDNIFFICVPNLYKSRWIYSI